ncbi:MAG: glycoside hydrolase family 9 protein [Dermatophilaceae bacterium]
MSGAIRVVAAVGVTAAMAVGAGAPAQAMPLEDAPKAGLSKAYDFDDLLGKSVQFYEAQMSGAKPAWNRTAWRASANLTDGADNKVDLSGGWHDAGDNVKFGFPMAWTGTQLSWNYLRYPEAFAAAGEEVSLKRQLRHVNDYFIKAHPQDNVLWVQVGEGQKDHPIWAAPETSAAERRSFKVDATSPGTDVAAETAASMAAASMVFAQEDPAYSAKLLDHATRLYAFADKYRGKYSDAVPDAAKYYNSFSGYQDELVWGALWLHKATGDQAYLAKAEKEFPPIAYSSSYTMSWDNKAFGSFLLLAEVTDKPTYFAKVEQWLDGEMPGGGKPYTPGGLLFGTDFLSVPYAMGVVNGALAYMDLIGPNHPKYATYRNFVVKQTDYVLGANPESMSYVVGFGEKFPTQPHHRAASGVTDINATTPNKHVLVGALIGGPGRDDQFSDKRTDYRQMEPAISSNAKLVGVAAAFVKGIPGVTPGVTAPAPAPAAPAAPVAPMTPPTPTATPTTPPVPVAPGPPAASSDCWFPTLTFTTSGGPSWLPLVVRIFC